MKTLAERLVRCAGWRWLPGMRTLDGIRIFRVDDDILGCETNLRVGARVEVVTIPKDALPDLDDASTRAGVLVLLREARQDPHVYIECRQEPALEQVTDLWSWLWRVKSDASGWWTYGSTSEAEALVRALEAVEVNHEQY